MTAKVQWRFMVFDPLLKRRRLTTYHLTEQEAKERYGQDVEKVEWTRMEFRPIGSPGDFMNGPTSRAPEGGTESNSGTSAGT